MVRFAALSVTWLLCIVTSACGGNDSPTAPSPAPAPTSFNGQWTGVTLQGQPIGITVSSDRVTAVTVGFNYAGCSGTKTASDLNAEIVDLRNTPQPPRDPYYFAALLGPYSESDFTEIQGFFTSPTERSGMGIVLFVRPGCGESLGIYTVTKRSP